MSTATEPPEPVKPTLPKIDAILANQKIIIEKLTKLETTESNLVEAILRIDRMEITLKQMKKLIKDAGWF